MYTRIKQIKGKVPGACPLGSGVIVYPRPLPPDIRAFQQKLLETPPVVRVDVATRFRKMWLWYVQTARLLRVGDWDFEKWNAARFYIRNDCIEIVEFRTMVSKTKCKNFFSDIMRVSDFEKAAWGAAVAAQGEVDKVEDAKGQKGGIDLDASEKRQRQLSAEIGGALRKINSVSDKAEGLYSQYLALDTDDSRAEALMKKACASEGKDFAVMVDGLLRGEIGGDSAHENLLEKKLHKFQTHGTPVGGAEPGEPLAI
ncbi:MAG: hypothetical protein WBC74_06010 [Candidatus Omnitrophota bacterium]